MRIEAKNASALSEEAAKLIMAEARHYPFTRLIDLVITLDPEKLELLSFRARSVVCQPRYFVDCEAPIAVLRTQDGMEQFFQQMLVAVALIDERKEPKDEPLKPKVHLPKG